MIRSVFFILTILYFNSTFSQELSAGILGLKVPVVKCTEVKDQYRSSTCWSFSSMSFLESELLRNGKGAYDLSEMFIARHSMLRKIILHLRLKGQNYFTPGGQFHDVVWAWKKYGLLPEAVYNGKPLGQENHDHAEADTVISRLVRNWVQEGITELDNKKKIFVDSLLDYYYGKVPDEFIFHGKKYTPQSFAKSLGLNPDDYVEITSYTHHPFWKSFVLEDKYNWTSDNYFNVTIDEFEKITDNALENNFTVGWDGDADDNYFRFTLGLAWLPDKYNNYQLARQEAFSSQSTLLNHIMQIAGMSTDNKGRKWYYIKNSWGTYFNPFGGYIFMRDDYFKIRTVAIIVNRNAIPADIRLKLDL